jgi:hypothetical protein
MRSGQLTMENGRRQPAENGQLSTVHCPLSILTPPPPICCILLHLVAATSTRHSQAAPIQITRPELSRAGRAPGTEWRHPVIPGRSPPPPPVGHCGTFCDTGSATNPLGVLACGQRVTVSPRQRSTFYSLPSAPSAADRPPPPLWGIRGHSGSGKSGQWTVDSDKRTGGEFLGALGELGGLS